MERKQHTVKNLLIGNKRVLYACGRYGYICGQSPEPFIVEKIQNQAKPDIYADYKTGETFFVENCEQQDDSKKLFNTPYLVNHQPLTTYFENYTNEHIDNNAQISNQEIDELVKKLPKTYIK